MQYFGSSMSFWKIKLIHQKFIGGDETAMFSGFQRLIIRILASQSFGRQRLAVMIKFVGSYKRNRKLFSPRKIKYKKFIHMCIAPHPSPVQDQL